MGHALEQSTVEKQSTLQKTLTSALNELGLDAALVAIAERETGPLTAHISRGFSPRDVQAILRALSLQETGLLNDSTSDSNADQTRLSHHPSVEHVPGQVTSRSDALLSKEADGEPKPMRVRMISPGAKSLLAAPLRYKQRVYGVLVIARKETATFSKKEKSLLESAAEQITSGLERASLFDGTLILGRPLVAPEPVPALPQPTSETFAAPSSYATPEIQERIITFLQETVQIMPFDRAWVTMYDPIAGAVEVLGLFGEHRGDSKRDLKPGQRLALDASASGWSVRHRKPRIDHDLASTQGRFQDHKPLYKDRFLSAMVVPFFVRGQVGGTVALASKTSMQYSLPEVRTLEPLLAKLAELIQGTAAGSIGSSEHSTAGEKPLTQMPPVQSEPMIRKQERQAAIGEFSAFLATEVREPLASIRAQLEEVTGAGILDFDSQTRVENAMRDLIRVEAILHEILDFAKPLALNRRTCRVSDIIENALTVVATELDVNRIHVTKDYDDHLNPVRCDEGKMQQVFLSIFKNALEAMAPGGHLHIEVTQQRANRSLQITVKNDGVPIPTEHVGKVFEPYFTTKRSGTGLGLATVKKIVEEHHGHISIVSGPGQGTALIIRLPAQPARSQHYRGRGRRPPRRH